MWFIIAALLSTSQANASEVDCVKIYRQANALTSVGTGLAALGGASGLAGLLTGVFADEPPKTLVATAGGVGLVSGAIGAFATDEGKKKAQEFSDFQCVVNASGDATVDTNDTTQATRSKVEIPPVNLLTMHF